MDGWMDQAKRDRARAAEYILAVHRSQDDTDTTAATTEAQALVEKLS